MIFYGILLLIIGVIAFAFYRAMPRSHPVSTIIMYICLGVGAILLVVGIVIMATRGHSLEVDSLPPSQHLLIGLL